MHEILEDHGLRTFLDMLLCPKCIALGRSIIFIIIIIIIVVIVIIIHAYTVPRGSASSRFFRTAQIENGVNGSLTLTRD